MEDKKDIIKNLVDELNKYAYDYYVLDNPSISDKEYDEKYDKLIALEKETQYVLPYSPSQRVGDIVLSQFEKYKHRGKLWSLDKAQNVQNLMDWHNKNKKAVEEYNLVHEEKLPKLEYVLTKKFDGLTVNCTYGEDGILKKGASRGTGEIGEDITSQIKTIKSIPLKINNNSVLEIRGEAIMTKTAFQKYNDSATVSLKNLRNGAAGALRNLNIQETAKRNLSAFFYDIGYNEGHPFNNYVEMMNFIKDMGMPQDDYLKICTDIEQIQKEIDYIGNIRDELEYDIDGVVIAINDIKTRNAIGYTVKFPKWAIAYKFEAKEVTTTLLDVEWNVSRNGRVTPTAILEPVELGGVTVKRATLNNIDDINRKNVKIGTQVFLRRSNDVIPEIMGVVEDSLKDGKDIQVPTVCPNCTSRLVQNGVHYYCENTLSCKPQMVKSLVHFASREAMNIEGFSEKTSEQLFENLNIKSIADLYKIQKEDLLDLDKFGEKKSQNLIEAIEKSKDCMLSSFIYALGIPNVGKKTAIDLADNFKSIENIKNCFIEDLIKVKDIGEVVAKSIYDFFKDEKILTNIEKLMNLGVDPKFIENIVQENIFTDKTVVVTGSLESYSRNEIKEKLKFLGAKVSSSVSKNTDYLLIGQKPGSKYDKALTLGVNIITEEEFNEMINNK